MDVQFPNTRPVLTPHDTVQFQAVVDGADEECEVSSEALRDHFGASSRHAPDLLRAFISGKESIQRVARQKRRSIAGRWLLVSTDFGPVP
jgi:hypothetical protein